MAELKDLATGGDGKQNFNAVDENPLTGSTHVCGPTAGDSFSLISCLILLID